MFFTKNNLVNAGGFYYVKINFEVLCFAGMRLKVKNDMMKNRKMLQNCKITKV